MKAPVRSKRSGKGLLRSNIVERVQEITNGEGVPVVYDSVGKDTF